MKKIIFTFLLFSTALSTAWAIQPELCETNIQEAEKTGSSFTYVSLGATGSFATRLILGFDPFIGRRQFLTSQLALDFGAGVWAADRHSQLYYLQNSLLYYPAKAKGFYFGAGLTGGAVITGFKKMDLPWANIPLTVGHQFSQKGKIHSFLQMQVSPITTPALGIVTVSWGVGF